MNVVYTNTTITSPAAIYESVSGQIYYTHTDHLGSITEISNQQGQLVQRMAYYAWGNRSLLTDNTGTNQFFLDRGYTGHSLSRTCFGKHLDEFGLINMLSEDFGFVNLSATKPLAEQIPTKKRILFVGERPLIRPPTWPHAQPRPIYPKPLQLPKLQPLFLLP